MKIEIHLDDNDSAKEMNRRCLAAGEGHSPRQPPSKMEKRTGWHARPGQIAMRSTCLEFCTSRIGQWQLCTDRTDFAVAGSPSGRLARIVPNAHNGAIGWGCSCVGVTTGLHVRETLKVWSVGGTSKT